MKHSSRISFILVLLLHAAGFARAEDFDPTRFIGMDLQSAFKAFGAPQEVFTLRGAEAAEDNVVFFYPEFVYLFWYDNRVWQVRCDKRFAARVFGYTLGMDRKTVEQAAQRVLSTFGDSLYFTIDTGGYPLRVRLLFEKDILTDLYVYRSDY